MLQKNGGTIDTPRHKPARRLPRLFRKAPLQPSATRGLEAEALNLIVRQRNPLRRRSALSSKVHLAITLCHLGRVRLALEKADPNPFVRARIKAARAKEGELAAHEVDGKHIGGKEIVLHLGKGLAGRDLRPAGHESLIGSGQKELGQWGTIGPPRKRAVQLGGEIGNAQRLLALCTGFTVAFAQTRF